MSLSGHPVKEYFRNLYDLRVEFEAQNPRNLCFRGRLHVLPATKLLFIFDIIVAIIMFIAIFPWSLLVIWIPLFVYAVTIYALKLEKGFLMWPYVLFLAFQFFMWTISGVFLFIVGIVSNATFLGIFRIGPFESFFIRFLIAILIKILILLIGIFVFWKALVVNACRKYFDDKECGDSQVEVGELSGLARVLQPF